MTLPDLLAKVESAAEGSYNLDAELAKALAGWTYERRGNDRKEWWREANVADFYRHDRPPRYTASLDAAVALAEKVLPGYKIGLTIEGGAHRASVYVGDSGGPTFKIGRGANPALAICHAIIKAKIAEASVS